jgi:hypothetical protein
MEKEQTIITVVSRVNVVVILKLNLKTNILLSLEYMPNEVFFLPITSLHQMNV